MQYTILLQRQRIGNYRATVPAAPGCRAVGRTRDEALDRVKTMLESWLAQTEIATIEVAVPNSSAGPNANPWLATAGSFADDPALEPMLNDIYAARAAERPTGNDGALHP